MFFNHFKEYFLKRKLKNSSMNSFMMPCFNELTSIGIIVDESAFFQTNELRKVLNQIGFLDNNISIVTLKKNTFNSSLLYPHVSWKKINWKGQVQDPVVLDFIQKPFDILINYYQGKKTILEWLTMCSKAKFRVGFYTSDKRLNDIMIHTHLQNYNEFVFEMNRILKLFNKN